MHQEVDTGQTKVLGWHLEHLVDLAGFETRDDFLKHSLPWFHPGDWSKTVYTDLQILKQKVLDSINQQFPAGIRNGGIRVWQGPCANANLVLKDPKLLKHWQESAKQTVHVETELAGVYMAARHAGRQNYPVLAIRGLSDIVGLNAYTCMDEGCMQFRRRVCVHPTAVGIYRLHEELTKSEHIAFPPAHTINPNRAGVAPTIPASPVGIRSISSGQPATRYAI